MYLLGPYITCLVGVKDRLALLMMYSVCRRHVKSNLLKIGLNELDQKCAQIEVKKLMQSKTAVASTLWWFDT